ncbi:MAG: LLM class flavin-dependent oxidoreductase [Alphaproteobacteria bacterium]
MKIGRMKAGRASNPKTREEDTDMEFGIQFFPDLGPEKKPADKYWAEALHLVGLCDELGYTNVRTVEHYFTPYGGYTPNPHIFLAAASQRAKKARFTTGAILPVFNHPLKVAAEIGMVDAITGGRLECGFARAFLPIEFTHFGVSLNESKERFTEGMEIVRRLLEEEKVSYDGKFHKFQNVTSLPRPTQQPRPPFWVAALATPESFENAGRMGYNIMAIPMGGGQMKGLLDTYRNAWRAGGHKGNGKIMLAFHMFCAQTHDEAVRISRDPLNRYLKSLVHAASDWTTGTTSKDYAGYDKIIAMLDKETWDTQIEKGAAWIGTPDEIRAQIAAYLPTTGGFDIASLQVNFNTVSVEDAERSMRLFSQKVMPHFVGKAKAA